MSDELGLGPNQKLAVYARGPRVFREPPGKAETPEIPKDPKHTHPGTP